MRQLLLAILLLSVSVARAENDDLPRALKDGIEAYNQVEYQPALMYLRAALQHARGRRILALTYFYLGCTYLALEENAKSRAAFETLLAFQPDYVPSRSLTSPKISGFLSRVRNEYPTPASPPTMAHQPPLEASAGSTRLYVEVQHLSPRLRPVLYYRPLSAPEYLSREVDEVVGTRARFTLPAREGGVFLYYFALSTRSGIAVRKLGSAKRPFRLDASGRSRSRSAAIPWYRRWWVWTIVGVAAAGAGAGAAYALTRGSSQARVDVVVLRPGQNGSVEIFGP